MNPSINRLFHNELLFVVYGHYLSKMYKFTNDYWERKKYD